MDSTLLLDLYRQMCLSRRFEEAAAKAYSQGKVSGFLHLYIGQEAVAVGAISAAEPTDYIVATYREHAHYLARTGDARGAMAELFGRATGCSGGRGGSMHLFDARKRFFGGWAIVGGHVPIAAGVAFGSKYRGEPDVTPFFLEAKTYRFRGHSVADPAKYRTREEVQKWMERDPIGVLAGRIRTLGIATDEQLNAVDDEAKAQVQDAVLFAEESPVPASESVEDHVYA